MKKVLVLDDNSDILEIVEYVLIDEGFIVKSISRSNEIIDIASNFSPDIILLDYLITDGNGGELCREIKSHPKLGHIPVIMISGFLFKNIDFEQFGCDDFIMKPFDLDVLVGKINNLLTSKTV